MSNFLVLIFSLIFLSSCAINNIYKNHSDTSEKYNNPIYIITKLSHKKYLTEHQIESLKNSIKSDPSLIKLLSPYQILNLLGEPKIIKKQKFIEIWQYKNKCILNIVWEKNYKNDYLNKFLLNNNNSLNYNKINFKIVWLESLNKNKQKILSEACFYELANIIQP